MTENFDSNFPRAVPIRNFLPRIFSGACAVFLFFAFSGSIFINSYEKTEEIEASIEAVVSSIQDHYIALVYNESQKGIEREIGFHKNLDIRLIHKQRWDKIKKGEKVLARYVEKRRVREGKSDTGEFKQDSFVQDRKLTSLEFEEPQKRQLISGF